MPSFPRVEALDTFSSWTGIPPWATILGAVTLLVMLLVWAVGGARASFAAFLGGVLAAAMATGWALSAISRGKDGLRAGRAAIVTVLAVFVPVVFDPHTGDVFNLPKYTLVVVGALAIAGLWAVSGARSRAVPHWRNGLQWILLAILVWTAISAFTGVDSHVGLLGDYGSYDGLYAAIAFGVVMMATAEAFEVRDVRKVAGILAFAGGSIVVLYGLFQLHDLETHHAGWDFINWTTASIVGNIFSTFGNPNHLGGFLAMLLPILVVVGLGGKRLFTKIASAVLTLLLLAEVVRTVARGAWVAVVVSAILLAVMLAPELRKHPWPLATGAGVLAVAVGGMALAGKRFIHQPLSSLWQTGSSSSIQQRYDLWHAAIHLANHHPITGVGPDAFALVYPQVQSAAWVKNLGPNYLVNGAHDIFMNVLADQGYVGLLLFLALLVTIALRAAGAWRRLRAAEKREGAGKPAIEEARSRRLILSALSASVAAYVAQAVFNVQQVGLSFTFWLVLGLLLVVAGSAGVPDTLNPRVLLSRQTTSDEPKQSEGRTAERAPNSRARRGARGRRVSTPSWVITLTSVGAAAVVALLAYGADGPYRADHAYWGASVDLSAYVQATKGGGGDTTQLANAYFADMKHAFALNPWEALYPATDGQEIANSATKELGSSQSASTVQSATSNLKAAKTLLQQSMKDDPLAGSYAYDAAEIDMDLARIDTAGANGYLSSALSAVHRAIRDNPRDSDFTKLEKQILSARKSSSK
jgi:hypothetical protein